MIVEYLIWNPIIAAEHLYICTSLSICHVFVLCAVFDEHSAIEYRMVLRICLVYVRGMHSMSIISAEHER